MEFQKGNGVKFINVRCSYIVLFKRFKNLYIYFLCTYECIHTHTFMCEIMIKFIWCIVKCRFLLGRSKRKVIVIQKMFLLIAIKQKSEKFALQ